MIKRLKRQFVLTATLAVFIVLAIVISAINLFSAVHSSAQNKQIMDVIVAHKGDITEADSHSIYGQPIRDIRYFAGWLDSQGQVTDVSVTHIASISEKDAEAFVLAIMATGKTQGRYQASSYTYVYRVVAYDDVVLVVGLDVTNQIAGTHYMTMVSLAVGGACMLIFCLVMYLLSNQALKPYVRNIEKQRTFITNASHELKTPIAIISANTEVTALMNGESEWTQSTMTQVERLNNLVTELVMMARMEERDFVISDVDASAICEECVQSFKAVMSDYTFTSDITPDVMVKAEKERLRELCNILLDNAHKYCDAHGTIAISLQKKGRNVALAVRNDYAKGKDVDYTQFFDRFYRQETSHNSSQKGFGIGLSMAETIVESFDGRIQASWHNGVITFTVTLNA